MRLARLDDLATGIVLTSGPEPVVLDVAASLDAFALHDPVAGATLRQVFPEGARGTWKGLIDGWGEAETALAAMIAWYESGGGGAVAPALSTVRLQPPLCGPDVGVFPVGANFAQHAAQATARGTANADQVAVRAQALLDAKASGTPPWGFTILPRCIIGPDDPITPKPRLRMIDYEGEVAVTWRVGPDGVTPWGVAPWNDVSVRGHNFRESPRSDEGPMTWSLQKNFDNGNVCGPWLVVDPAIDVNALGIETRVNGEVRQRGNTSEMVYTFAEVIEHLSTFFTLRSGDIITSGTPAGTAIEQGATGPYLQDGDVVEVEIESVGILRNPVAFTAS